MLDSEEARARAGDNEMSLYHIIKPEIDFAPGTSEYDPRVYEKAAENFKKFQDNGWILQDNKQQYYIYAQTMNGKTQYGLVVCAYVNDYMTGVIKKHEALRAEIKEEDQINMFVLTMPTLSLYSLLIQTTMYSTLLLCVMWRALTGI